MKTAGKVFVIIEIVGAALSMISLLLLALVYKGLATDSNFIKEVASSANASVEMATQTINVISIVFLVVGLYMLVPIGFGIAALIVLAKAQSKSSIIPIAILTLIFCNILAGIFLLCSDEKDYPAGKVAA